MLFVSSAMAVSVGCGNASDSVSVEVSVTETTGENGNSTGVLPTQGKQTAIHGKTLSPLQIPKLEVPPEVARLKAVTPLPPRPELEPDPNSRTWFGIYYQHPFYAIELTLQETADPVPRVPVPARQNRPPRAATIDLQSTRSKVALTGTATVYVIEYPSERDGIKGGKTTVHARCEITGWRDQALGTFSVATSKWLDSTNRRYVLQVRGVESKKLGQLGGWVDHDKNFIAMTGPNAKESMIQRAIAGMHVRSFVGNFPKVDPKPEEVERALSWMDRFPEVAPDRNEGRWMMGDHEHRAMGLFINDEFQKLFGKRFEDLTPEDLNHWGWILSRCQNGYLGPEAARRAENYTAVNMFTGGEPGWTSTVSAVWMHRVFEKWTTERLEALSHGPYHTGSFRNLQILNTLVAELQRGYYPSTRKAFIEAQQASAAQAAEATLAGMNTAEDVVEVPLDQLVQAVDSEIARPHLERYRIAARGQQIEQLQGDLETIAKVPDTVDTLRATAAWKLILVEPLKASRLVAAELERDSLLPEPRSDLGQAVDEGGAVRLYSS